MNIYVWTVPGSTILEPHFNLSGPKLELWSQCFFLPLKKKQITLNKLNFLCSFFWCCDDFITLTGFRAWFCRKLSSSKRDCSFERRSFLRGTAPSLVVFSSSTTTSMVEAIHSSSDPGDGNRFISKSLAVKKKTRNFEAKSSMNIIRSNRKQNTDDFFGKKTWDFRGDWGFFFFFFAYRKKEQI